MKLEHTDELDYRGMYLRMMNACEDAINLLIDAQRECEDMYMQTLPAVDEEDIRDLDTRLDLAIKQLEESNEKNA